MLPAGNPLDQPAPFRRYAGVEHRVAHRPARPVRARSLRTASVSHIIFITNLYIILNRNESLCCETGLDLPPQMASQGPVLERLSLG